MVVPVVNERAPRFPRSIVSVQVTHHAERLSVSVSLGRAVSCPVLLRRAGFRYAAFLQCCVWRCSFVVCAALPKS